MKDKYRRRLERQEKKRRARKESWLDALGVVLMILAAFGLAYLSYTH